jgi:hypothetical protein
MIAWKDCVFREAKGNYIIYEVFYPDDGSVPRG